MSFPAGPSLQLMAGIADAFGEVSVLAAQAVWNRWFSSQRFYRKLAQFESMGWVERPRDVSSLERVVRLTEEGRRVALGGRDPEEHWRRRWDGRWRLVLFDIPETQRTLRIRLCRRLRESHYGYLQNSVWVSPDSTAGLGDRLRDLKMDVEILTLMEARPCGGESDANLVNGAWDFAKINRNYEVYLEVLASKPLRPGGRSFRAWLEVEWKAWSRAAGADPLLPEVLLPSNYRGREAWKRRTSVMERLFRSE